MTTRILVIEDDAAILNGTPDALKLEGFDAIGAENGRVGLKRVWESFPDLIISDIAMPDVDGHEVLMTLQKDPITSTIPFLFLTARVSRTDIRQGMELGANDYLTKPFTTAELLAAVKTQLGKRAVLAKLADKKLNELRDAIMLALPHELRTPLVSIIGFGDLLGNSTEVMEPERVADMGQRISKAGRRLFRLIENYLVYAQIEMTLRSPEWVLNLRSQCVKSPQTIIRDQATLRARQANREADLVLSSEEVPAVQISAHYLEKIVQELVDNAFKFSRAGTPVYVLATVDDEAGPVLRVSDRGRGMTRQQIADIGPYMQFNRKIYEQQGSGLGLIIAQQLAELHNGRLTINSVPDQQTTVSVNLPLASSDC